MAVTRSRIVDRFMFDFIPFTITVFIKILSNSFVKRTRTRDAPVDIDRIVCPAESYVVARTTRWVVSVDCDLLPCEQFLVMGDEVPIFDGSVEDGLACPHF